MPADYTGDPTSAQAPGPAPNTFGDVVIRTPVGADPRNAASVQQMVKHLADYVQLLKNIAASVFGNGADGDKIISAGATASIVGVSTAPFYDDLTLPNTSTLQCLGSEIHVRGTFTWDGKLEGNGRNGVNGIGGGSVGHTARRFCGVGGRGTLAAGEDSPDVWSPFFVSAPLNGSGGAGASGAGGDGSSGGQYQEAKSWKIPPYKFALDNESGLWVPYKGGRGGGGGGGDGANSGGSGGEGGQCVFVFARELVIGATATAEAKGGNGGNSGGGNCGGGGGAQGGCFIFVVGKVTGTFPAATVTGGAAGTATGTGVNGQAGAAGSATIQVIELGADL